jgi:CheY-like chemotaxis protein
MQNTRVLLVEDEPFIRDMTAEILRDEGFDVAEAWNGDEAVRLLDVSDIFHVLCTDVRMPGLLDGIEVAAYARTLYPAIPVLVVSGYAGQLGERLRSFVPEAVFISKPYEPSQIVAAVRRLTTP